MGFGRGSLVRQPDPAGRALDDAHHRVQLGRGLRVVGATGRKRLCKQVVEPQNRGINGEDVLESAENANRDARSRAGRFLCRHHQAAKQLRQVLVQPVMERRRDEVDSADLLEDLAQCGQGTLRACVEPEDEGRHESEDVDLALALHNAEPLGFGFHGRTRNGTCKGVSNGAILLLNHGCDLPVCLKREGHSLWLISSVACEREVPPVGAYPNTHVTLCLVGRRLPHAGVRS